MKELKRLSKDAIQICEKKIAYVIHSVSNQENWKMENINVYEADDFISEIFWGSTSEVLKKILVLNIFSNSRDDVLVKLTTI